MIVPEYDPNIALKVVNVKVVISFIERDSFVSLEFKVRFRALPAYDLFKVVMIVREKILVPQTVHTLSRSQR